MYIFNNLKMVLIIFLKNKYNSNFNNHKFINNYLIYLIFKNINNM